jgi:hypothetical protein
MFTWLLLPLHVSIRVDHHQVIASIHLNKIHTHIIRNTQQDAKHEDKIMVFWHADTCLPNCTASLPARP